MLSQPNKWILLCILSLLMVMTFQIPFLHRSWQHWSTAVLRGMDATISVAIEIQTILFPTKDKVQQALYVQEVERENRQLQGRIQALQVEQEHLKKLSSQSAFLSKHPTMIEAIISKTVDRWLVLTSIPLSGAVPRPVYKEGIFVGTVVKPDGNRATFQSVANGELYFLVRHEPSGKLGKFQAQGTQLEVVFFETIDSIKEGDSLVTVPDGEAIPAFIPVLKVQTVHASLSNAVTRVRVVPLVSIAVADVVMIQP